MDDSWLDFGPVEAFHRPDIEGKINMTYELWRGGYTVFTPFRHNLLRWYEELSVHLECFLDAFTLFSLF